MFSELNFDGLGVRADWPLCVQGGVCVIQPGLQLRQGMLELTQGQQGSFQLVLRWEEDTGFQRKNRYSSQTNREKQKAKRALEKNNIYLNVFFQIIACRQYNINQEYLSLGNFITQVVPEVPELC